MKISEVPKRVEDTVSDLIKVKTIPGIQYVVVSPEGIQFECCKGVIDISACNPVTPDSLFMASSVTKTLTAAAILQLKYKGKLKLDTRLSSILISHPYGNEIKISHLLNHTSGIPNPMPLKWLHLVENHSEYSEGFFLDLVLKKYSKLNFSPGSKYGYSNLAYWLLGSVIERVSGLTYEDYMRTNIFDALCIYKDELNFTFQNNKHLTCGHLKKWTMLGLLSPLLMDKEMFVESALGRRRFKPIYMNGPAYGGLIGTARAFSKFLQNQLQPKSVLFDSDTKAQFYCNQTDGRGRLIETTLGWHRGELNGIEYFGKPGGGPGFQSNMRLYPSRNIGTIWLANETGVSEGPIHKLTDQLDRHFL